MKPGRKLIEQGPEQCSDADILAILIGTGGKGFSSEDVARELLEKYGGLPALMGQRLKDLAQIRGVGPVKAIRLAAAYELAARIVRHLEHHT